MAAVMVGGALASSALAGEASEFTAAHRAVFPSAPAVKDLALAAAAASSSQTDQLFLFLAEDETEVIVEVVASWCGPCRTAHPAFLKAAAEDDSRRWAVLRVDDAAPGGQGALAWTQVAAFGGKRVSLPAYLLLGADGTVMRTLPDLGQLKLIARDADLRRAEAPARGLLASTLVSLEPQSVARMIEAVEAATSVRFVPTTDAILGRWSGVKCVNAPLEIVLLALRKDACLGYEPMGVVDGHVIVTLFAIDADCTPRPPPR